MLLYILFGIIIILILFFIYIRLKYQFWALQPVYHYYDFQWWFYNKGIIREDLPKKNKYVNLKEIWTKDFSKLTNNKIKEALTLIQYNYLFKKDVKYYPKLKNIIPYFEGHFASSFWTFFYKPNTLIEPKTNKTIDDNLLVGFISSRPLYVQINKQKFNVYYVDYLCVLKSQRKKGIAQQLIQTHEYNQSHNNKQIVVSLFKREEELTGIVPLVVYNTYAFNMFKWNNIPKLSAGYNLLTGDKQNLYYVYNFIQETEKENKWDIMIYPEISNIIFLVESKNIFIKMIILDTEIQAIYVFKKTCTSIQGKECIDCIASINRYLSTIDFINGFKIALQSIRQKYSNYGYLMIEDITNNKIIIDNLLIKTHPYIISPTAYFFYNFAYSTFLSNKCLIIN